MKSKNYTFYVTKGAGYYTDGTPKEYEVSFEVTDEEVIEAVCNIVYGKKSDEAYEVLSEMYQNGAFDLDKARNKYEDEITDYFVENGYAE